MITWTSGDLFSYDVIAHGCNTMGIMGAGIAAEMRRRWPMMYDSYRRRCDKGAFIPGDVLPWKHAGGVVFNLATQHSPGPTAQPWMIAAATGRMITEAIHDYGITRIAMPLIGCGLGGLGEDKLAAALAPYETAPVNLVVVRFARPGAR